MKNSPTEVKKKEMEERKHQEELEKRTSSLAVPRMTVTQTTIPL